MSKPWVCETDLAPHRQLPAGHAHLPHCSGYTVCIVEIERRKPRREWLDLTAGIEGGERLGGNCLNVDQRIHITIRLDPEDFSRVHNVVGVDSLLDRTHNAHSIAVLGNQKVYFCRNRYRARRRRCRRAIAPDGPLVR
jgi:hypothetical protein